MSSVWIRLSLNNKRVIWVEGPFDYKPDDIYDRCIFELSEPADGWPGVKELRAKNDELQKELEQLSIIKEIASDDFTEIIRLKAELQAARSAAKSQAESSSEQPQYKWFEWNSITVVSYLAKWIRFNVQTGKYICFHADGTPGGDEYYTWSLSGVKNSPYFGWKPIPSEPEEVRNVREEREASKYRWYSKKEHGIYRFDDSSGMFIGYKPYCGWKAIEKESAMELYSYLLISPTEALRILRELGLNPFVEIR